MPGIMTKRPSQRATDAGLTIYTRDIPGDSGNHGRQAQADVHASGYVGISQLGDNGIERVLLTAEQFAEIVRFVRDAEFER